MLILVLEVNIQSQYKCTFQDGFYVADIGNLKI